MEQCKACGSHELSIGVTKIASGATVHPIYCTACGNVSTQYVKKQIAEQYAKENGPLEYVKTRTQLNIERGKIQPRKCEVCGADGAELHHWAPSYLFREESDRWPTSYLCVPCHRKWHDVVTPNMSHRKQT